MDGKREGSSQGEPWAALKIGEHIRIIQIPIAYSRDNCSEDTLLAYQYLIDQRLTLPIAFTTECEGVEYPWIEFEMNGPDGVLEHHSLMINHDGWVRINPEKT